MSYRPRRQRSERARAHDRPAASTLLHRQARRRGLQRLLAQRDEALGRRRGGRRAGGLHHGYVTLGHGAQPVSVCQCAEFLGIPPFAGRRESTTVLSRLSHR